MDLQIDVPARNPLNEIGRVKFTLELDGAPAGGSFTYLGTSPPTALSNGTNLIGTDIFDVREETNAVTVEVLMRSDFGTLGDGSTDYLNLTGTRPRTLSFTYSEPGGVSVTAARFSNYVAPSSYNRSNACRRVDNTPATLTTNPVVPQERHALDLYLVLDKSGSMNSPVPPSLPGATGEDKLPVLKSAVQAFIDLWNAPGVGVDDDRLGLAWFSSTGQLHTTLVRRDTPTAWDNIRTAVGSETASGMTAMGDGVSKAVQDYDQDVPAEQHDFSVSVFTDGLQNRPVDGASCCPPAAGEPACKIEPDPAPDTPDPDLFTFCDLEEGERIALASRCMFVQAIGIGASNTTMDELLNIMSVQTGGASNMTSTSTVDHAFAALLVELLKGNTMSLHKALVDTLPAGASQGPVVPFEFDPTVQQLMILLSWGGDVPSRALTLDLAGPDGEPGKPARTLERDFYSLYTLVPERSGPTGSWEAQVRRRQSGDDVGFFPEIDYSLQFLVVEGPFSFSLSFDDGDYNTGQEIVMTIAMSENGTPLAGQANNIRVEIAGPGTALSNLLHDTNVDLPPADVRRDPLSPGERKVNFLLETTDLGEKLRPEDKGLITPTEVAPGIYQVRFSDTQTPGRYAFRAFLEAEVSGERVSRVETRETVVRVKTADAQASTITATQVKPGTFNLAITLFDRFGNVVGPDRQRFIRVAVAGRKELVPVSDPTATGNYTGQIAVPPGSDPLVRVSLGSKTVKRAPLSQLVEGDGGGGPPKKGCLAALLAALAVVAGWFWKKKKS